MRLSLLLLLLALPLAGCPTDDDDSAPTDDDDVADDDDTAPDDDDAVDDDDTAPDDDDTAPDDDDAGPDDDDSAPDDDDTSVVTGSLSGDITRSADYSDDGIGDLHVIVFGTNPIAGPGKPETIATALLPAVDLTDPATVVPYAVDGIPVRVDPYWITAIFDDNGTASPSGAPSDTGDLIPTINGDPPTFVMDSSIGLTLDLELNAQHP